MGLLNDIFAWTQSLPLWQQDAARRLFQHPEGLSAEDYVALYALLKSAHGLPTLEGVKAVPLSKEHLPSTPDSSGAVVLKSLRDLTNVNCIAPNQSLPFEPAGVTVVYGGNGSGKSGYARVMKCACRARDQSERVLPDANDSSAQNCTPKAIFDITIGKTKKKVDWSADINPPDELATIAVFDSHCARLYLTKEQEVAYLPYGLDIVEALANTVLPELEQTLDQVLAGINTGTAQFGNLLGDTAVGKLISEINHETDPHDVETLATLSQRETARIAELESTLGEAAPAAKAQEHRLSAERLKETVQRLDIALAVVDEKAVAKLKGISQEARDSAAAEQEAAKILHAGEALLPGTGAKAWKALFEAARKFATVAYPDRPFPYTDHQALCVLCQQPLHGAEGRMKRFEKYVQDDVSRTAEKKRLELTTAIDALKWASLDIAVQGALSIEIQQLEPAISAQIDAFQKALAERRDTLVAMLKSDSWNSLPKLDGNPRQSLRDLAAKQYRRSRDYQKASNAARAQALRKERAELLARKALSSCREQVLALLARLKTRRALESCRADLNTKPISMKSRELASTAVTSSLKSALDDEFKDLGMAHIRTKLKERNVKGRILHQLVLDVPTSSRVDEILSEGEQRAIAIGAFLAELSLATDPAAIVFDDPVSSLDHKRRGLVAKRLASESSRRQVIVFTHDVVFLSQLQSECAALGMQPGLRFLEKIGKHAGSIQNGLPWDHKSYAERIDCLEKEQKSLERLPWPPDPNEELARRMIQQYSFLRSTIERVVQDFVLNATVKRFDDYIRVDNLDLVVGLAKHEVSEIRRLYKRCHGLVEAHDPASPKDGLPPTAEEFGRDIDALKTVLQTIRDRRKCQG